MADQPTLYRVDLKRDDIRDIGALVELELPAMMILLDELRSQYVPVEPDYEAAEQRAKNIMLYIVSNPQMSGDEFDINVDTLVREILDAALGIGDNDE